MVILNLLKRDIFHLCHRLFDSQKCTNTDIFQFNKFQLYQWSKIFELIHLFQIFLQDGVHLCYMILQIEKLRCYEKMETLILQCLFSEYHWQRIEHVQFKF